MQNASTNSYFVPPAVTVTRNVEAGLVIAAVPAMWQAVYAAAAQRAEQVLRERWYRQHSPSLN